MNKPAHFYCYGSIGENDPLFKVFTGENDPCISSQKVIEFLSVMDKESDGIIVHINSRGGNVDEGFAIHDLFKNSGKKVKTVIEGQCASIATVILFAGEEREATENATGLIHNPWIDPYIIGGLTADEIQKMADDVKREEVRILDFYVKNTGADRATIESYMKEEKKFSASEMLELKFITKIAEPVKAFAYHKKNLINNPMTLKEKINNLKNAFSAFVSTVQAASTTTADGTTLYHDGELAVGVKVYSDEAMETPSADGSYELENGSVCTVAGGEVTEIAPKAEDKKETDAEKIARLESEVATMKAEKAEVETEVAALSTRLSEIKSTYVPKTSGQQFKAAPTAKESLAEFNTRIKQTK